jgi:hypothetical protein
MYQRDGDRPGTCHSATVAEGQRSAGMARLCSRCGVISSSRATPPGKFKTGRMNRPVFSALQRLETNQSGSSTSCSPFPFGPSFTISSNAHEFIHLRAFVPEAPLAQNLAIHRCRSLTTPATASHNRSVTSLMTVRAPGGNGG